MSHENDEASLGIIKWQRIARVYAWLRMEM